MNVPVRFDESKKAAFEERVLGMLNGGALCLMISIGHRTGLLDAMAAAGAGTSAEMAAAAGLNERYVREWLGAMATGGVVEYEAGSGRYRLPPEHAACLTRAATPGNLAVTAQFMPVLAGVEDDIVACFRQGGGVPYSRYARFHEVMAEDSGQTVLPVVVSHILPLVPGLVERLERGLRMLDLGCGRGRALLLLAERFPRSSFEGYDLSDEAIGWARAEAARSGLANVTFEARDLSTFDRDAPEGRFDLVTTFDAVHDQGNPAAMLRGIRRALAEDGVYLAQDIKGSSCVHANLDHPMGPLVYTISCLHCMTVSLAQGGAGLGAMWGRELAERMFREAGFGSVGVHELEHDIQNYYYVCRP